MKKIDLLFISLQSKNVKRSLLVIMTLLLVVFIQSCKKDGIENSGELKSRLSEYAIFQGNPTDLIPNNGYKLYELSSQLFTDYAEKQRLIKIPSGTSLITSGDGLPDFPEGTIIVKTFFYYNDKRNISKGKNLVETRLLIKSNSKWNVGTYLWNENQTEANLITTGLNKTINWIDINGDANVISYHIPNNTECATCHNSDNSIMPIGPKIRNLNMNVLRDSIFQNQLTYLQNENIFNSINPASFSTLPNYKNPSSGLEKRARAYLEMNCAHCHNEKGFASDKNLRMSYEIDLEESKITHHKDDIVYKMEHGEMPKIGTTIIDKEGLELIRSFIDSLKTL